MSAKYAGGRDRFQRALTRAVGAQLVPVVDEEWPALNDVLWNRVLGRPGTATTLDRTPSPRERFVGKLFSGWLEISKSYDSLRDVGVYLRRFPFRGTGITRERYLRFHIEAFYSELYILQCRMKSYATLVEREYKGDIRSAAIHQVCESLSKKMVEPVLKDAIFVRGRHVHEVRLCYEGIDRLEAIALLVGVAGQERGALAEYHKGEYRRVRLAVQHTVATSNKTLRDLLDAFCHILFQIIFHAETKAIRYPPHFRPDTISRRDRSRSTRGAAQQGAEADGRAHG